MTAAPFWPYPPLVIQNATIEDLRAAIAEQQWQRERVNRLGVLLERFIGLAPEQSNPHSRTAFLEYDIHASRLRDMEMRIVALRQSRFRNCEHADE